MSNLPEPVSRREVTPARTPPTLVRAAVSPSAIALTAAGVAIGLLAQSIVLAVVLGILGWTGRMTVAFIAEKRRERANRPRPAKLDPWSVPEPWRQLVEQAAAAQTRFDRAAIEWPEGPLKEHVEGLRPRFYSEIGALGSIAERGAALSGWTGAPSESRRPTSEQLAAELAQTESERARLEGNAPERERQLAQTEEAIAAQLRARHHAEQAANQVHDRLRVLVARLDETVTNLLTLETEAGPGGGIETVAAALGGLKDDIETLQAGLDEARTPPDSLTA